MVVYSVDTRGVVLIVIALAWCRVWFRSTVLISWGRRKLCDLLGVFLFYVVSLSVSVG